VHRVALAAVAVLLLTLAGCAREDPRETLLAERASWSVEARSWVPVEGGVNVGLLLTAPAHPKLEFLTVRVRLYGPRETLLDEQWVELPVAGAEPGVGRDTTVLIESAAEGVEGITVETVDDPTPEEATHSRELRELGG